MGRILAMGVPSRKRKMHKTALLGMFRANRSDGPGADSVSPRRAWHIRGAELRGTIAKLGPQWSVEH